MPVIEVSVNIKGESAQAYSIVKKINTFPEFMRDIKNIEIIKKGAKKRTIYWNIDFDGVPLEWTEEVNYDDKNRVIKFKMLKGDFYSYKGKWNFYKIDKGVKIHLVVYVDWGIPKFERFVGETLNRKIRRALLSMLISLKTKIEKN